MDREFVRRVFFVLGTLLFLALLWIAREVLLFVFAALLFALIFVSLANWASRLFRLSYKPSLAIVVLFIGGLLFLGGRLLAPSLSNQFSQLAEKIPKQVEQVQEKVEGTTFYNVFKSIYPNPSAIAGAQGGGTMSTVSQAFSTTADFISGFLVIFFTAIFLAGNPSLYKNGLLRLVPPSRRPRARDLIEHLICVLKYWLLGQLIAMTVVGVTVGITLGIIGIPLAASVALLAAFLEFVPFIGPIIAAVPALLLASTGGLQQVMTVAGVFLAVQILEGYVLTPLVQHRTVDLPPVLTLVSVVLLGTAFGFIGLFVATPLAAVALVLVQELYIKDYLGEEVAGAQAATKSAAA